MDLPVSCDFRRTIKGKTPKTHTRVVIRSVLGWMGMMSVFKIPNADIPPTFHVFHKTVEVHTGKIDSGRMS
jgi:hypothetical protein